MRISFATLCVVLSLILSGCDTATIRAAIQQLPTPAPSRHIPDATLMAARLRLSNGGMNNPDLIAVVAITGTTWADDCLGLPAITPCRPIPTPGYQVAMELDGQRYLVHVDEQGQQVRLASSPVTALPDTFIQWRSIKANQCHMAFIASQKINYGICGEAMLTAQIPPYQGASPNFPVAGETEAAYLRQKYAPFAATILSNTVVFTGTGTVIATPAEQRSIAEWAVMRDLEAEVRYLSGPDGVQLAWEEKSPTFCGGLWIYQTGLTFAWDCTGNQVLAADFLPAPELEQFYSWLDSDTQWHIDQLASESTREREIHLHLPAFDIVSKPAVNASDELLAFARQVYDDLTEK